MNERVFKTPLPQIHVCDLKETPPIDGSGLISAPLVSLLHKTMEDKNKAILLLNRRVFLLRPCIQMSQLRRFPGLS